MRPATMTPLALLDRVLGDQRRTRNAARLLAVAGVVLAVVVTMLVFVVIELVPSVPPSASTAICGAAVATRLFRRTRAARSAARGQAATPPA